jgi:hypothetical protein
LCSAATIAPLFIVPLYSAEGSVADRPSIGFCIVFLLGFKYERASTVVLGKEKYITAVILADCGSNFESG